MPRFSDLIVRSTVTAFVVSAMSAASAGIDLTPSPSEYVAEGMKHQQLTFVQDKQRIEYELPAGWKYDGGGAQVHLTPPNKKFAEATITAAPLAKPEALDENTIARFSGRLPIPSPIGGVVIERRVNDGQFVQTDSTPLVTLESGDRSAVMRLPLGPRDRDCVSHDARAQPRHRV